MAYLIAGPMVALVGIVAVFFVLRRKSVEKRSMYSARRSQIEHKVRAARQRTLTPRGRSEHRQQEQTMAATAVAPADVQQTVTYEAPAWSAPPVAPPAPDQPAAAPPWETTSAPAPAAPSYDYPPAAPAAPAEPAWNPPAPEPFQPAPEPTRRDKPSEPAWTPAPAPAAEPVAALEPVSAATSTSPGAAGGWSVVNTDKDGSISDQSDGKKKGGDTSSWQLASGEAPGIDADEPSKVKRPSNLMAIAQYAVLVVGLVMVLIGVMVMVANSHVT